MCTPGGPRDIFWFNAPFVQFSHNTTQLPSVTALFLSNVTKTFESDGKFMRQSHYCTPPLSLKKKTVCYRINVQLIWTKARVARLLCASLHLNKWLLSAWHTKRGGGGERKWAIQKMRKNATVALNYFRSTQPTIHPLQCALFIHFQTQHPIRPECFL
jgi:hypothetical protein